MIQNEQRRPARNAAATCTDANASSGIGGLLDDPNAVLSRTDLRDGLHWPRRAVDAIFRGCPTIVLPGYSRPVIRVRDYVEFLEEHTYDDDRVRP